MLGIQNQDFDLNQLKHCYIECCKKYHPDASQNQNDKFIQIEEAYQTLKEYLKVKEEKNSLKEDEDERIKHTIPQHRQYLSFEGVGYGTPSTRFRQYQKHRLSQATETVHEFNVEKVKRQSVSNEIVLKDVNLQRQLKPKQGFDRLVEDLIQEAIAKGDFENLPGTGKPLNYRPEIPYVDATTYKLNQILINNGYVPEWIKLEREIIQLKDEIRDDISLSIDNRELKYQFKMNQIENKVKNLNQKIDKYNTLVPIINKQKIHFILKNEIKKLELEKAKNLSKIDNETDNNKSHQSSSENISKNNDKENFITYLFRLFS